MSIVTLRSSENQGGLTNDALAAVNFQNFFKDPIYFNKDDQVQVTSVTINQEVNEVIVTELNNTLNYMLLPAMDTLGDMPFFNRHRVFLTPGTYTLDALAVEVKTQLNNSVIAQIYEFDFEFDKTATPPGYKATYKQLVKPAANNTGLQGQRYDGSGKVGGKATALNTPLNIAEFPLVPVTAGANNTYAVDFKNLNGSLETPTKAQQRALLTPVNLNKQLIKPDTAENGGTDLTQSNNFQYIFEKGIYANGGTHEIDIGENFVLDNINLMISFDNSSIKDYVKIKNDAVGPGGALIDNIYEVTGPGANGSALTYDYDLQNINDYAGKPTAMSLGTPAAITGLNNSGNNTIAAPNLGTGYQGGALYTANVTPTDPTKTAAIIHVLAVNGVGAIVQFQIIYGGDGYVVGDVLDVSGNGTAGTGAKLTVGTGGIRQTTAGTNNVAGTALTVGSTYNVFFPNGTVANPTPGGPSFPAATFQELIDNMNSINLSIKIDSIDATTRRVTAISFNDIGLASNNPAFTRLKNVLSHTTKDLIAVDNNGSFTAISTSLVQITAERSQAEVDGSKLRFASRVDGLSGLATPAATGTPVYPANPLPTALGGNGAFDFGIFSAFENFPIPGGAAGEERAAINGTNIPSLKQIDETTGEYVPNGREIVKLLTSNFSEIPLTAAISHGRTNFKLGFVRNQKRETYEGSIGGLPGKKFILEDADILFETFNGYSKVRRTAFGNSHGTENQWTNLNGLVTVAEYNATDTISSEPTRRLIFTQNLKTGAGYDPTLNDRLAFNLNNINNLTITYSQPTNAGFTDVVFNLAPTTPRNFIKETIFPLNPVFALSPGLPLNRANPAGGADQFLAGVDYIIQGRYDVKEVPVQDTIRTSGGASAGNAYTNLQHPAGTGDGLSEPTDNYTFTPQGGTGNPDCLQLPITYTFGLVTNANIDLTNANPQSNGTVDRDKVGFTQFTPSGSSNEILGFDVIENENDPARLDVQNKVTVSDFAIETGLPPSMVVELPDFNIQGYSGASQDKMKIVATIPTEEWGTAPGTTAGTLHYKPLFPLPIDVNLPEDREMYSLNVRLRNLDGTLARNLTNPTTVTFYKKPREGKELERILDNALQRRSENQDQKIAMGTSEFPRV